MKSKDELKETDVKNRACFYCDDIIQDMVINFGNILSDEKLYENVSVYDIFYKTLPGPKPLRIRFDKIDRFIRVCGGEFRHLLLFDYGFFDKICDKIKYLVNEKSDVTDSINHNFRKIRIDSYNSLSIEKILTFHNFLEKVSYKNKSDTRYF